VNFHLAIEFPTGLLIGWARSSRFWLRWESACGYRERISKLMIL
jgi:hypothetical protein